MLRVGPVCPGFPAGLCFHFHPPGMEGRSPQGRPTGATLRPRLPLLRLGVIIQGHTQCSCQAAAPTMALSEALERLDEEAICSICLEYMSEPVSVDCGHNFCRSCIGKHCQEKGLWNDTPFSCPQCRAPCRRSSLRPNRQLANIVESIRQLGLRGSVGTATETGAGTLLCPLHNERLKLFCEVDEQPICVVCRESQQHRSHTVYPIEEAAQGYKVWVPLCERPRVQLWCENVGKVSGSHSAAGARAEDGLAAS